MSLPSQSEMFSGARFSITVAQSIDLPGVEESDEAWRRADLIKREVANVLAKYGVPNEGKAPLCNVWENP